MKVIATNISQKQTITIGKETMETGMYKKNEPKGIFLTAEGVKSDAVMDRRYHGGEEKACYIYGFNNYTHFKNLFPEPNWEYGMFGENLTLENLQESAINVGDIYTVGEAEIQITEPRLPCNKFGYRMGSPLAIKEFANAPFPGVYVRVLKDGWVKPNDTMVLLKKWHMELKLTDVYTWLLKKSTHSHKASELFQNEAVTKNIKDQFRKVLGNEAIIAEAKKFVRATLEGEGSGHDWWHISRVHNLALTIAKEHAEADLFIVELGALLHDIGDHKFHNGDHTMGPKLVGEWMYTHSVKEEIQEKVIAIVKEISYKGAQVDTPMSSIEGEIVQDADRLDAIGAIGIARTFAYGGNKGREMHNPEHGVENHLDFESYKKTTGPTINHFYEKLLLLKDRMNTGFGKKMAEERHRYMEVFLEEFFEEWEGNR
jgi:uncharacterized protein